jgi:diguanylate cyclase
LKKQPPYLNLELVYKDLSSQRNRRLRQVLRATQVALLLICIVTIIQGYYTDAKILLATGVLLFSVDWAIYRHRFALGSWILLSSLTLMLSYLAWTGFGLNDSAILGFCGVLIFSALLGHKRLLIFLTGFILLFCFALAYVNHLGLYVHLNRPTDLTTGAIIIIIFCVISFSVWLMVHDYLAALSALTHENELVKNAKLHIEYLALHDSLTHLPNRIKAQTNFARIMEERQDEQQLVGLIFIDLDNLKPINDSLGHSAGDYILTDVAGRLVDYTQDDNLVCRYGGDEFIVFLPNISHADDASAASMEILELISANYRYRDIEIFCTCSIGIALAPQDGAELDTLIKKADIAMYHSKDSGRNSFRFFNPAFSRNMHDHINLISSMRKALLEQKFELYYQPKIDLTTQQLCGFEALLRWQHPEQGFIPPNVFIPLAESSGLIIQLGEWVIKEACRQAKIWVDAGLHEFSVAVNISSIQFKRGNIDSIVLNALAEVNLAPHYLELELTESLLIEDNERLTATLKHLRSEGVHLSIDDFGTGYSNLGYLQNFEVETLKIDQSFVRKMEDHKGDAAIVRAIIQMATSLGLQTIAEGVEDATTAALVRSMGCTQAQGYYWARPMPAAEAKAFWDQWLTKPQGA